MTLAHAGVARNTKNAMADRMKYDKLVRDKIPEIIESKGGRAIFHVANDAEYWQKLKEKLGEEVGEFCESESEEEIADIFEVIEAICEYKKFDVEEIKKTQKHKKSARGAFNKRIILEES